MMPGILPGVGKATVWGLPRRSGSRLPERCSDPRPEGGANAGLLIPPATGGEQCPCEHLYTG